MGDEEPQQAPKDHLDCPCGKRGWLSLNVAKRATRTAGNRLRFYRCDLGRRLWHATNQDFGHRSRDDSQREKRKIRRFKEIQRRRRNGESDDDE